MKSFSFFILTTLIGSNMAFADFKLPKGPIKFSKIDCILQQEDLDQLEARLNDSLNRIIMSSVITKIEEPAHFFTNTRVILGSAYTSELLLEKCPEKVEEDKLPLFYDIWITKN